MGNNPTLSDIFPLPVEAKKLDFFVGEWIIQGTLTFEEKPLKVNGLWKMVSAAAGWGVLNIGKMEIEDLGSYEEIDILGFDPSDKSFHLFSVTNTAATHDHKGQWSDDKIIHFLYEGLQEGKIYKEEIEIRVVNSSKFEIHETDTLNSKIISTMDVTLTKRIS